MFFIKRRIASLSRRSKTLRSNILSHEYSAYLDNADIKKRRGYSEYHNFDDLCALKQSADNAADNSMYLDAKYDFERKIRSTEPYSNVAFTHRTVLGSISGYIPFTDAYQAKQKLSQELDNIEYFLRTFESDFYAQKRQESAIFSRVNHLLGEKAVKMMRSSLIKAVQIQKFLNNKHTPFDYLGSNRIKNSPDYHAFITLAYSINANKNKLIKQAKPTLLSPTKFSTQAQIDDIFPAGSVYRNYIDQTKTWTGYFKSFIPFTNEYKAKRAVANELKSIKRFINISNKEFSRNTIAQLAVKYPKTAPQIANASLKQPTSTVSITSSNLFPTEPIKQSPTQVTGTSSDARVLLRTSSDSIRKLEHERISPRALEKELAEENRIVDQIEHEAQTSSQTPYPSQLVAQEAKRIIEPITDKNNHNINLVTKLLGKTTDDEHKVDIVLPPGKRPGLTNH